MWAACWGLKNGLSGLDTGQDWRTPVADRLFLPSADGGRAITDAVTETYHVINTGRALSGESPLAPKKRCPLSLRAAWFGAGVPG